jgi:hypothetical protein
MPAAYANAHYIWLVFVGIAVTSAVGLIVYGAVIRRLDGKSA